MRLSLINSPQKFYWQDQQRQVERGRLSWFAEEANESFWHGYWQARATHVYYANAEAIDLEQDETGQILKTNMVATGLHLEAGCGLGYWVAALRKHGFNVEGLEYAETLVQLINQVYPELPVRAGNALAIERPEAYYDSYLSFGVVEHRQAGPEPFLREAYRVLKPGGQIFISVPYFDPVRRLKARLRFFTEPVSLPFFQYGFSEKEFTQCLRDAGFTIKQVHYLFWHRLLLEESRLYRWLSFQRGARLVKAMTRLLFAQRTGHMILVVGQKN